jgi:hypothetical protein
MTCPRRPRPPHRRPGGGPTRPLQAAPRRWPVHPDAPRSQQDRSCRYPGRAPGVAARPERASGLEGGHLGPKRPDWLPVSTSGFGVEHALHATSGSCPHSSPGGRRHVGPELHRPQERASCTSKIRLSRMAKSWRARTPRPIWFTDTHEAEAKDAQLRKRPSRFGTWVLRHLGFTGEIRARAPRAQTGHAHEHPVHRPPGS